MEFHFVKLNLNGTYLSLVDPSYKSRFICFQDREKAWDCVDYVSSFRSKYGVWPAFDMSKGKRKVARVTNSKLRTPEEVKYYLDVDTHDFNTIDRIASRTNTSYFCVLKFEADEIGSTESINMSGQEMDAMVDDFLYRDLLEYNLKVN